MARHRHASGCHRLLGLRVVRLADFVLAHHDHIRHGDTRTYYRRVVQYGGSFPVSIDSLGYRMCDGLRADNAALPVPVRALLAAAMRDVQAARSDHDARDRVRPPPARAALTRANNPREAQTGTHGLRTPAVSDRSGVDGRTLALRTGMYRTCIAVVDASRARLFTYERSSEVEGIKEHLIEERDLVNPARRLRPSELFSETRPGLSRTGGLQYGFDDHRDAHIEALDAEFSRLVIGELVDLLRAAHAKRVILCASPRMLGELRDAGHELAREGVEIDEIARDLVKLTPPQLREHLESHGLLPAKPSRRQA